MKLFGYTFGEKVFTPLITLDDEHFLTIRKQDVVSTVRPELQSLSIPEDKKPANIIPVKSSVLNYSAMTKSRGQFSEADYDLAIINRIADTDSYVAQAFLKKTGLMFKEGCELTGPDPKTIQYSKLRLAQIARATGIPTEEFLRSIGASLITKSNAFLVKARKESASGGRIRQAPGTNRDLEPVAGYFLVPAETMLYECDKVGKVIKWKQCLPDGSSVFFKPEDVVHMYFNRKEGFICGTPTIVPVIDDIRSLRKIEENIELLVYQHLFPLFHYQIGNDVMPASIDEQGNDEIEVARNEIRHMPSEGGLVTSHRHEIKLIGAENRSLRAEGYLNHFKKRVFSGLGISAVDMGEGECYSADTETLTENGWKYHWQIDHLSERIATFNPESKKIEFWLANYKHESKYVGPMYHFLNKNGVDILVTPKHDMWVGHFGKWNKTHAEDLYGKAVNAQILQSALFNRTSDENLDTPESIAKLIGWVLGIGKYGPSKKFIILKSKKFRRNRDAIGEVLKELNIPYKTFHERAEQEYTFAADALGGYFKKFLKENGFKVLDEVLKFPMSTRKIISDELLKSGGMSHGIKKIENLGDVPHWWYVNSNKSTLDLVQTILLASGYLAILKSGTSSTNGVDYVNVRCGSKSQHTSRITQSGISQVDYNGEIYCYNVPNHLFLTRRNGRVAINGNTANRATSDNMSRNLVDSVKDIQRVIEAQFSSFVINELLLESTFGSDVLNDESKVTLKFKEIDLDYQIRKEAHYTDQFNKNIVSQHEARIGMGRQPMRHPSAEEVESDPNVAEKYPEWYATHFKLIGEPTALINAVDEPYSAAAIAAAGNRSTSVTSSSMQEAGDQQKEHEVSLEKAKSEAKIAIAKLKLAAKKDSFLSKRFEILENDTVRMITENIFSQSWLNQIGFMTEVEMTRDLRTRSMSAFASGYSSVSPMGINQINATIRVRSKIENRSNFYVQRLIRQTLDAVKRQNIDTLEKDAKIQKVKAAFEALRYRNVFIEDIEIRKAFSLGVLEAARDLGKKQWVLDVPSDSCASCKIVSENIFQIGDSLDMEDIPPLHANSRSRVRIL